MAKLGYWDIRGLAQPIRLLLAYKNATYEDKLYSCGPPPDFDKSGWLKEKFTLGLDFPNLPYYIDGDVKITQNLAILRYLGRKYNLVGSTEEEERRVDQSEQQVTDFRMGWVRLCYNPAFETEKVEYLKNLPGLLKGFSDWLGDRKYFAGSHVTYVDFIFYEIFSQHLVFSKESFADFKNLTGFVERIESCPDLSAYLKSDKCIKWPFNGDMASFGSRLQKSPF